MRDILRRAGYSDLCRWFSRSASEHSINDPVFPYDAQIPQVSNDEDSNGFAYFWQGLKKITFEEFVFEKAITNNPYKFLVMAQLHAIDSESPYTPSQILEIARLCNRVDKEIVTTALLNIWKKNSWISPRRVAWNYYAPDDTTENRINQYYSKINIENSRVIYVAGGTSEIKVDANLEPDVDEILLKIESEVGYNAPEMKQSASA